MLAAHEAGTLLHLATSGTVGRPRVVRRTTASWFDSFPAVADLTGLQATSRVWVPGPLAGTMNLFAAVLARAVGAELVDSATEATHAHLTPSELRRLLASDVTLAGLQLTVAGDRLHRDLHVEAADRGAVVTHYYGAAELSFVAWGSHEEDLWPFPGVEVVERDGVLWVGSPYLAEVDTEDGLATVGDRGTVTPDGRVVVRGRGDAAVVTGGATVLVEDVEQALRSTRAGEVAVIGVPHADLGQVVAAVLVSPADAAAELAALRDHARAVLPESHRPRVWFLADAMPLTAGGKPDRVALREQVALGVLRRASRSVPDE